MVNELHEDVFEMDLSTSQTRIFPYVVQEYGNSKIRLTKFQSVPTRNVCYAKAEARLAHTESFTKQEYLTQVSLCWPPTMMAFKNLKK